MTATYSSPFFATLAAYIGAAWRFLGRGLLAFAILFMAGVIAVVTAIAGIALAITAILMRMTGGREMSRTRVYEASDDGAITLEARKTPRGWTVE